MICHAHGKEIAVKAVQTNVLKKKKKERVRPKRSGFEGGRVLNVLDLNKLMVNNGLDTSRHWGMLLWSDRRNWRDVLRRLNHSLSTLLSNALTPHPTPKTSRPHDHRATLHHQSDRQVGSSMTVLRFVVQLFLGGGHLCN